VLAPALLLTGCEDSGADSLARPEPSPASSSPGSPSPSTTPPEELCTRIVAHWAREVLGSDSYGDYQSMGLSNGQYEILMEVVDVARAEEEKGNGDAATRGLIDGRTRELCAERYRDGNPSAGPWR
jgi:hypothetical protein